MKKKIYTRKKYAMGGTALNIPSIQEDLFNANRMYQESQIEAATNPLVTGMNMAGSFLTNAGANMIQSGVGEHFANSNPKSGFGKFMKSNSANLGNLLGNGIKTLGMTQHAYGGDVGKEDPIKNKKRNVVATRKDSLNLQKNYMLKEKELLKLGYVRQSSESGSYPEAHSLMIKNYNDVKNKESAGTKTQVIQPKGYRFPEIYPSVVYREDNVNGDKNLYKSQEAGDIGVLNPQVPYSFYDKRISPTKKDLWVNPLYNDGVVNYGYDFGEKYAPKIATKKLVGKPVNKNRKKQNPNISFTTPFSRMAYGGDVNNNVPVEVEGEEIGETPNGEMLDFQGPSHEQGGIPIELPEGTEIYSKRIKVDGVSMADRKKKREKKTYTLEQLLDKNKSDILLKNSLQRTNRTNEIEEDADTKIQQTVSDLLGQQEQGLPQHAYNPKVRRVKGYKDTTNTMYQSNLYDRNSGTFDVPTKFQSDVNKLNNNVYPTSFGINPYPKGMNEYGNREQIDNEGLNYLPNVNDGASPELLTKINKEFKNIKKIPEYQEDNDNETDEKPNILNSILGNVTAGDALGMYGNMYQAKKLMDTIKQNRAGDTANINAFKNYGEKGLAKIDESKQYLKQKESDALSDLNLNRNAMMSRNRNSSRSVNGMRALDLASDVNINKNQNEIYANTANGMMNILGQESQLLNNQDAQVMQGEQARDLADRQDRDNYFNQLQQGFLNNGKMISQTGHDLNDMKTRRVTNKLMNSMSPYAQRDIDGNKTVRTDFDRQQFANYGIDDNDFDNMTEEDFLKMKYKMQLKELSESKSKKRKS